MTIVPNRCSRFLFLLLALCAMLLPLASSPAFAQNLNFTAGVRSPYDSMGSSPSLALFNGRLYAAFRSNDTRNVLYVASSGDGVNFGPAQAYPQFQMGSAPSLAVFNNRLYLGFQANDPGHVLFITSSTDGVNFVAASGKTNIQIGSAPSLAAFNGRLFAAFKANDSGNALWIVNSTDGIGFSGTYYGNVMQTNAAPALAAFNNRLYLAHRANGSNNILYMASSGDGFGFTAPQGYTNLAMGSAPTLGAAGGSLYLAFRANDARNLLFVTASSSGGNFPGATGYSGIALGGEPSAAPFGNGLTIAFKANDASNALFASRNNGTTGGNSGFVVSEAQYNQMFPRRVPYYNYSGLIAALSAYPAFANSGSDTTKRQEAAAFLANINHETGGGVYVREQNQANWPLYCSSGNCGGKQYYGRGPTQLSWDYNYRSAGDALGIDLLNNPDRVADDSATGWKTALWYWNTQRGQAARTPHDAMISGAGFGETIRAINGGLECNGAGEAQRQNRINLYINFSNILACRRVITWAVRYARTLQKPQSRSAGAYKATRRSSCQ